MLSNIFLNANVAGKFVDIVVADGDEGWRLANAEFFNQILMFHRIHHLICQPGFVERAFGQGAIGAAWRGETQ